MEPMTKPESVPVEETEQEQLPSRLEEAKGREDSAVHNELEFGEGTIIHGELEVGEGSVAHVELVGTVNSKGEDGNVEIDLPIMEVGSSLRLEYEEEVK